MWVSFQLPGNDNFEEFGKGEGKATSQWLCKEGYTFAFSQTLHLISHYYHDIRSEEIE